MDNFQVEVQEYQKQQQPKNIPYYLEIQNKKTQQHVPSPYLNLYLSFFNSVNSPTIKSNNLNLSQILISNQIYVNDSFVLQDKTQTDSFKIREINQSYLPEVFKINIQWGKLSTTIKILLVQQPFQNKNYDLYSYGNYGTIYLLQDPITEQIFVLKSFEIQDIQRQNQKLRQVIKQYYIALIMSSLEIGPKIKKYIGFDIIVYNDCAVFSMEYCRKKMFNQSLEPNLKQALYIMHSLNILHLDIKPQNLAFSSFFNKWVFIDFGLSQITNCQIGFKTKTLFAGTYQYCYQQMKNALWGQSLADLYYNDVYSLKKTFQFLKKQKMMYDKVCISNFQQSENDHLNNQNIQQEGNIGTLSYKITQIKDSLIILIKSAIISEDMLLFQKAFKIIETRTDQIQKSHFHFLINIVPSLFIKEIYFNYLQNYLHGEDQSKFHNVNLLKKISYQAIQTRSNYVKKFKKKLMMAPQKSKTNYKNFIDKILTNQIFINQTETDKYLKICFSVISFRSNQYNLSLKQKELISKFVNNLLFPRKQRQNITVATQTQESKQNKATSYLDQIISFIKNLLEYCSKRPYSQIKIDLFPEVAIQNIFINSDICTKNNNENVFKKYYKVIYEQNKENFFQMIYKLFKLRQGYKFLWYQSRQIYDQSYEQANIKVGLSEVWQDKTYLLAHLYKDQIIQQFIQIISRRRHDSNVDVKTKKYNQFQRLLYSNTEIQFQKKQYILNKLKSQDLFINLWSLRQNINVQMFQYFYLKIKDSHLTQEIFHFCALLVIYNNFINAARILKKIDSIINCPQISNRFLNLQRLQTEYYNGNNQKSLKIYQKIINNIQNYSTSNQFFYLQIIRFSQKLRIKQYTQQNGNQQFMKMFQKIYAQYIQKINKILVKLKEICIYQNKTNFILLKEKENESNDYLKSQVDSQQKYIKNRNLLALFSILRNCIKYMKQTQICHKQVYYQSLKQFEQQFRKMLTVKDLICIQQLQNVLIFDTCIQLFQQNRDIEILQFLTQSVMKKIDFNKLHLRYEQHLIQYFMIYFRIYQKAGDIHSQNLNFVIQNIDRMDSKTQIIKNKKDQLKAFKTYYELGLNKIYQFLLQTRRFYFCIKYDAPTFQITQYFYNANPKQIDKIFLYWYQYTNHLKMFPEKAGIQHIVRCVNYSNLVLGLEKDQEFIHYLIHNKYSKQQVYQNPYYWIVVSVILSMKKNSKNTFLLIKIAKSLNYIMPKAKDFILQFFYMNIIQKVHDYHICNVNEKKIRQLTRKERKIWKKYFFSTIREDLIQNQKYYHLIRTQKTSFKKDKSKKFKDLILKTFDNKIKKQYENLRNLR